MTSTTEGLESVNVIYVLLAICILAVIANLVIMSVIIRNKTFRGAIEIFMGNMAISDILLAGIAIPIRLIQAVQLARGDKNFVGGVVSCKLTMFIPTFTISSSIITMVAISFERYMTIVRQRKIGHRGLMAVIIGIWVFSSFASAPQLYEYSIGTKKVGEGSSEESSMEQKEDASAMVTQGHRSANESSEEINDAALTYISCGSHDIVENFETIYASIIVFVIYLVPLVLLCINYVNIVLFLYKVSKQTEASGSAGAVSKGKVKVVKMLATLTAVFAILWAPYFILFTIEEITGTDDSAASASLPHTIKQTAVVLSTISNPILYYIYNEKFRVAAKRLVTCKQQVQVGPGDSSLSAPVTNY